MDKIDPRKHLRQIAGAKFNVETVAKTLHKLNFMIDEVVIEKLPELHDAQQAIQNLLDALTEASNELYPMAYPQDKGKGEDDFSDLWG